MVEEVSVNPNGNVTLKISPPTSRPSIPKGRHLFNMRVYDVSISITVEMESDDSSSGWSGMSVDSLRLPCFKELFTSSKSVSTDRHSSIISTSRTSEINLTKISTRYAGSTPFPSPTNNPRGSGLNVVKYIHKVPVKDSSTTSTEPMSPTPPSEKAIDAFIRKYPVHS